MRTFFSGDEDRARLHFNVARSKVDAFVGRCEKAGLKQNTYSFIFNETGVRVFAQYRFGQVQMQIHAPVIEAEEVDVTPKQEPSPSLVVFVGDEDQGYNFAVLDIAGSGTIMGRADTAREIMTTFPAADQREHYLRRYSVKTDRTAFDTMEYLSENYVESGIINLFSSTSPGVKCSPTIAFRCPELPAGDSNIYDCQSLDTDAANALGYLVGDPVVQSISAAFTARAWCYSRNTGTNRSFWGHKREVTSSTVAAVNRVSFGADVCLTRGAERVESTSMALSTFYGLYSSEYGCTAAWEDDSVINSNMLVGHGSLLVESVNTPAGLALAIGTDVRERAHGFYNSDPDQFAYGHSEPFTAPFVDDLYGAVVAAAADDEGTVPLGMYAYSDPAVFSLHASSTAQFFSPLTRYVSAKNTPMFVGSYDGDPENEQVTYSNIEARGMSFAVEHNGQVYEIYFKNFLEAKFTRNVTTAVFDKSDVAQVSIGAASAPGASGYSFITRLHGVFAQFRAADITDGRITADDPWPVHGSTMCYLHSRGENSSFFLDELDLFERINALRASLSVAPLALNIDLCVAARIHSEDMATNAFLGHEGSDGSLPSHRIDGTGFCGGATEHLEIGENAGQGYATALDQLNGWIASSDGHYEAMINPKFREIGLALAVGGDVSYRCAVFVGDSDI